MEGGNQKDEKDCSNVDRPRVESVKNADLLVQLNLNLVHFLFKHIVKVDVVLEVVEILLLIKWTYSVRDP